MKEPIRAIWDFIGFPLRAFIIPEIIQNKLKLTTLKEERFNAVLPFIEGKLLDVGCGKNELVLKYRELGNEGIGLDVINYEKVDVVVKDTKTLPFGDEEFDTTTLIAAFNHIPKSYREGTLKEIKRVLKRGGILIVTMINPFIGYLCHKITYWDFDRHARELNMQEENYGIKSSEVISFMEHEGFKLTKTKRFDYGLNKVFMFNKNETKRSPN